MPPPAHTPVAPPRAAPPPPTLPDELLQLVASLANRLNDLESHQLPELSHAHDRSLHDQLANDARRELGGVKRDVEELKLQVDDLQKSRDRRAGADHVVAIQLRLDAITKLYRQSVIASSRLIEAQQASSGFSSARDELFSSANRAGTPTGNGAGGAGGTGKSGSKKGGGDDGDDALMSATSDVTEGLRRTLQLMQQEVDRSAVSNELLESQTATLALTSEQYSLLNTLLTTSKALITSLARADLLDRLLLAAALLLFGLVCAYIVKRRVVNKGLRVASALTGAVSRGKGGAKVEQVFKRGMEEASVVAERASTRIVGEAAAVTTAVMSAVQAARTVVTGGDGRAERAAKAQERIREEQRREREEEEKRLLARRAEEEKAAPVNAPESLQEEGEGGLELEDMLEEGVEEVDEDGEFEDDDEEEEEEAFDPEEMVDEEGVAVEEKPVLPLSTTPILPTEGASTFTDEDGVVWDMVPPAAKIPAPTPPAADESTTLQEIPSEYPSATDPSFHAHDEAALPVVTSSSINTQPTPIIDIFEEEASAAAEPEFETPTPAETLLAPSVHVEEVEQQKPTATPSPDPEPDSTVSPEQEEAPTPSPSPSPLPIVVAEPQESEEQEDELITSTTIEEPLLTAAAQIVAEPSASTSLATEKPSSPIAEPSPSSSPSITLEQEEVNPTELSDADLGLENINLGYGGQPIISVFRNATPTAVTTAEEIIFTPLERLRPASVDVGDRDTVIAENKVEQLEQEEEELEKRDEVVEEQVVETEVNSEPSSTRTPTSATLVSTPAVPLKPLPTAFEVDDGPAVTFTDSDGTVWDIVPGGVLPPGAVLMDDGKPHDLNPASRKGGYQGFEMLRDYQAPQPVEEEEEEEEEGEEEWEEGEWEDYAEFEGEEYEDEDDGDEEPPLPEPATNVGSQRTSFMEDMPVETAAAPVPVPEAAVTVEEPEVQASQTPAPIVQTEVVNEEQEAEQQEGDEVPAPVPSATIAEPIAAAPVEVEEPVAEPLPISSTVVEEPTASPLPSSSFEPIPDTEPTTTVDSATSTLSPTAVDEPLPKADPISPSADDQVWVAVPGGEGKLTKDQVFYEGGISAREKEAMEKAAKEEKQRQEREKQPLVEVVVPEVVKRADEEKIEEDVLEGAGEVVRGTEIVEPEMEGSVELPIEELETAGCHVDEEEEIAPAHMPSSSPIVAPSTTVDSPPATPSPPAPSSEPILSTSDEAEDNSTTFEDIISTPDDNEEEDDSPATVINLEEGEELPLESDEYLGELMDEADESEGEEKVFRDEL